MCSHTSAQPPKLGRQQRETQPNSCDQSSAPGTARGDTKLGVSHDERMGFSLMYVVASGDVPFTRNGQEWLTFGTDWLRKGASHPRAASRQRAVDPPSPLGDPSSVHRTISRLPLSPPALSTPPHQPRYISRVCLGGADGGCAPPSGGLGCPLKPPPLPPPTAGAWAGVPPRAAAAATSAMVGISRGAGLRRVGTAEGAARSAGGGMDTSEGGQKREQALTSAQAGHWRFRGA